MLTAPDLQVEQSICLNIFRACFISYARKKKSIRNHIFILNGIINEALKKKDKPVDLVIVDYKQCFDAMWLQETMNDMFEAGFKKFLVLCYPS